MNTHADKTLESKKQLVANTVSQKQSNTESTFQFVDNRPEAIAQRKLQRMVNNYSAQQQPLIQKKENNTGLPDNLKSGIENLSGYSMDDVKVHYNSDKPAQLQAHAFAQGTGIYLGSGQEKHLPHEAWHVVQQKQGRVKPTMQMKGTVNINDDVGLENEADVMGARSMQLQSTNNSEVERFLSAPFKLVSSSHAAEPNLTAQMKWNDTGGIYLYWTPKIEGFHWFFDQGKNKFVYELDRPEDFDEEIVENQNTWLSEEGLATLGFEELDGIEVDASVDAIPFVVERYNGNATARQKDNVFYETARSKGLELWTQLQDVLAGQEAVPDTTALDARFDEHYFTDLDTKAFGGEYNEQAMDDDQYTASSWGYEDPSGKPLSQGAEEDSEVYDGRIAKEGDAHYANYFDFGNNGVLSADSNWRDRDKKDGAKKESVPNNIVLWKQYEKAAIDRQERGHGNADEAMTNLKVIKRKNIANDDTMGAVKVAFPIGSDPASDTVQFLPGSEEFEVILGTVNCKSVVRMLSERSQSLHKTISRVIVRPGTEGVCIDIHLRDYE